MQRIILIAISFCLSPLIAQGQYQHLVIDFKNGTQNEHALLHMQTITFGVSISLGVNSMYIIREDGQMPPVPISDIQKMAFVEKDRIDSKDSTDINYFISVYPNPTQDVLHVTGIDETTTIHIFNIKGVLLQSVPAEENETILNVSSLKSGMYILQAGRQATVFIKK